MQKAVVCILAVFLFSCKSPVDQLLLSNDLELKEAKAQEYFENCEFEKASPLFKDLIQSMSSSAKVEKVYFYYAFCDYKLEDYYTAAYEFGKLLEKFPKGVYAEKCAFYRANCYYHTVPKYYLDQDYNMRAAQAFQLFVETYPTSTFVKEANQKLYDLRRKRELKAFENAKLFHHTEFYKSAIHAFESVLNDFPDTERAEEVKFLIVESAFLLAEKSVEKKKETRYLDVEKHVQSYLRSYPSEEKGKHYKKVVNYQEKAREAAKALAFDLPKFYVKKKRYLEAVAKWKRLIIVVKDQEKKKEIADLILNAYYLQVLNAQPENKVEAIEEFVEAHQEFGGKVDQENAQKWNEKNEFYKGNGTKLLEELSYQFLEAGDYRNADEYFDRLLKTKSLSADKKQKFLYSAALSKYKYALQTEELKARVKLIEAEKVLNDTALWIEGKRASKVVALEANVKEELAKYPKALVMSPLERKAYSLAMARAEQLIQSKNSAVDQEEIVYLLILSSVKKARSVRKYERLPWYELADKKYKTYAGLVNSEKYTVELSALKEKIDKGLTKYSKK